MNYALMQEAIRESRSDAAESGFRAGYFAALEMAMAEGLFDEDFSQAAYDKVPAMVNKRADDFLIISGMR